MIRDELRIGDNPPQTVYWHNGSVMAATALLAHVPATDQTISIMSNSGTVDPGGAFIDLANTLLAEARR